MLKLHLKQSRPNRKSNSNYFKMYPKIINMENLKEKIIINESVTELIFGFVAS